VAYGRLSTELSTKIVEADRTGRRDLTWRSDSPARQEWLDQRCGDHSNARREGGFCHTPVLPGISHSANALKRNWTDRRLRRSHRRSAWSIPAF